MLYVSLIYSDLDLFMIYSRSFCDAMLARVISAYECMGEVTQLLSGFAQVTQLLCDLGRRARPSSPSHATHNDPGILVFVTSGSFFGSFVAILGPRLVCELLDQGLQHGDPQPSSLRPPARRGCKFWVYRSCSLR